MRPRRHAALALVAGFAAGAVPFSNLVARRVRGRDLRLVGSGTVSGTALYHVAGFGPMVVGGLLDVAKGTVGPALAPDGRTRALAGGLAVVGHNWSPLLSGAGGRGISPALGALGVSAWPGTALLLAGLAAGRLTRHTGHGSFVAQAALVPVLAVTHGRDGALAGACVVAPMWVKRLTGNRPPPRVGRGRALLHRLLHDSDEPVAEPAAP